MSTGRQTFKEREVSRAIRAAVKAGTPPQRVQIDRDGAIIVILRDGAKGSPSDHRPEAA